MNIIVDYLYRILPNVEYLLLLGSIFFTVALLIGALGFALGRRNVFAERLPRLLSLSKHLPRTQQGLLEGEDNGWMGKIAKVLHKAAEPDNEPAKKTLKQKLVQAGLRSKQIYRNFLATKIILTLLLGVGYLAQFTVLKLTINTMLIAVLLAAAGYYMPDLFLAYLTKKRKRNIIKALPEALDLMVICVQAGLGLDMTFNRVGEEIRPLSKDLSDEFRLTNLEISAGMAREAGYKNMITRTGINELRNLLNILIQAGRFGTSVASALAVHTEDMRTKRTLIAEEKAAKSAVLMLLPLVGFIFPGLFVVVLGPAGIKIVTILFPLLNKGG
jgi:tight adherence protein C